MADDVAGWVKRTHPLHEVIVEDEARQRASYVATRSALVPFLVPHRFEGENTEPADLRRARLGFGVGINRAYLADLLGHVRKAAARYWWGGLLGTGTGEPGTPQADTSTTEAPDGGIAQQMWDDVTRDGDSWGDFFEGELLEWILSSPGVAVVIDAPTLPENPNGEPATDAQVRAAGVRPYAKLVPLSHVLDLGWSTNGLRWIKLREAYDESKARDESPARGTRVVLYELNDQGRTEVSRWNDDGEQVGATHTYQRPIVDSQGRPAIPVFIARYGKHPRVPWAGSGMIADLADIVIDLFNLWSETREGFRDGAISALKYRGADAEDVKRHIANGSRFVPLGEHKDSDLDRIAGGVEEVAAGVELIVTALRLWAETAKRKAATNTEGSAAGGARSGESLKAEFNLDMVPVLRRIAQRLDTIETQAMRFMAQLAAAGTSNLNDLGVARDDEYLLEDEADRIARIVAGALEAFKEIPPSLDRELVLAWADALDFVDLSQPVEGEGGTKLLREVVEDELKEAADRSRDMERNENAFRRAVAAGGNPPPIPPGDQGATT